MAGTIDCGQDVDQIAQKCGFHRVNMMIEQDRGDTIQGTVNAIAQLATSTTSDHGTVGTPTITNAKLASQLEAAQVYINISMDPRSNLHGKVNARPSQQTKISIVGCMFIRFTRTTREPLVKRERTDTRR
jgi:hypothetical protein